MILTDATETPGQWIQYVRAVPTFPEHTFWIPFREVATALPSFGRSAHGTSVAAMELWEVDDWEYGKWLKELATLRDQWDDENIVVANLVKLIELLAVEPLTALDYHGAWSVDRLVPDGKFRELFTLYQQAYAATPNPLFGGPKMNRIDGGLHQLIRAAEQDQEFQWEAIQWMADHVEDAGSGVQRRLDAYTLAIEVAPDRERLDAAHKRVLDLFLHEVEEDGVSLVYPELIATGSYSNGAPSNPLLNQLKKIKEPEVLREIAAHVPGRVMDEKVQVVPTLASLAVLALIPGEAATDVWQQSMQDALDAISPADSVAAQCFFVSLIVHALKVHGENPEVSLDITQRLLGILNKHTWSDERQSQEEYLRCAALVIEAASTLEPAVAAGTIEELIRKFPRLVRTRFISTFAVLAPAMDALQDAEETMLLYRLLDEFREQFSDSRNSRYFERHL